MEIRAITNSRLKMQSQQPTQKATLEIHPGQDENLSQVDQGEVINHATLCNSFGMFTQDSISAVTQAHRTIDNVHHNTLAAIPDSKKTDQTLVSKIYGEVEEKNLKPQPLQKIHKTQLQQILTNCSPNITTPLFPDLPPVKQHSVAKVIQNARNDQRIAQLSVPKQRLSPIQQMTQRRASVQPQTTEIQIGYPRSMYYSGGSGDVPRLSDLRDALRKQMFDHKNYDVTLNSVVGRQHYNHSDAMGFNLHTYNEKEEHKPLNEILGVGHQKVEELQRQRYEKKKESQALTEMNFQQQQKMTERLLTKNQSNLRNIQTSRGGSQEKPYKFLAEESPFTKQKFPKNMLDLLVTADGKNHVKNFMRREPHLNLPDYMEGYSSEKFKRIKGIIRDENNKRQATDNYNIRFIQLKQYVNDMLDRGYTFKPPKIEKPAKIKFTKRISQTSLSEIDVQSVAQSAPVRYDKMKIIIQPQIQIQIDAQSTEAGTVVQSQQKSSKINQTQMYSFEGQQSRAMNHANSSANLSYVHEFPDFEDDGQSDTNPIARSPQVEVNSQLSIENFVPPGMSKVPSKGFIPTLKQQRQQSEKYFQQPIQERQQSLKQLAIQHDANNASMVATHMPHELMIQLQSEQLHQPSPTVSSCKYCPAMREIRNKQKKSPIQQPEIVKSVLQTIDKFEGDREFNSILNQAQIGVTAIGGDLDTWNDVLQNLAETDETVDKTFNQAFDETQKNNKTYQSVVETALLMKNIQSLDVRHMVDMERANIQHSKNKKHKPSTFKFNKEIHSWLHDRSPEYRAGFIQQ